MPDLVDHKGQVGSLKRLGWLGVVFSVLVNCILYWSLAYVNQKMDERPADVSINAFQVYTPPREIAPVAVDEERVEFKPEIESRPMESMESMVAPVPIAPRIPVTNTDMFDLHAIPVTVTDLTVASPIQVGPMRIPDVDTPPRRVRGRLPAYPSWAQSADLEGRVNLEFVVEADGTVSNVRVSRLEGDERFRAHAIAAVKKWVYQPGKYRSKSVPVRCTKELVFRFQD
jgi:TonB family protein